MLVSFLWIVIMSLILANVLCDLTPDDLFFLMPWFKLYELLVALSITKLYLLILLIIFYCCLLILKLLLFSWNFLKILFVSFEFANYTRTDLRFEIHLLQFFFSFRWVFMWLLPWIMHEWTQSPRVFLFIRHVCVTCSALLS